MHRVPSVEHSLIPLGYVRILLAQKRRIISLTVNGGKPSAAFAVGRRPFGDDAVVLGAAGLGAMGAEVHVLAAEGHDGLAASLVQSEGWELFDEPGQEDGRTYGRTSRVRTWRLSIAAGFSPFSTEACTKACRPRSAPVLVICASLRPPSCQGGRRTLAPWRVGQS
jgi:hypothetical protein